MLQLVKDYTAYGIAILIILLSSCSHGQEIGLSERNKTPSTSPENIQYLRDNSRKGEINENGNKYEYLIDYVRGELLEKVEYEEFLIDKRLLRKLKNVSCLNNRARIADTLKNGKICEINIRSDSYKISDQKIIQDENGNTTKINDKYPYGAVYGGKSRKVEYISNISIEIDGIEKSYEIDSVLGLYGPNFCQFGGWRKMIEAYEDEDRIYIYIQGGNAADTYYSKLIFDQDRFITSITVDYYYLSLTGSFDYYRFSGF